MKRFVILLFLTLCAAKAAAALRLPHLVGDGMVLQRNAEASLWGWCSPHSEVTVRTSWSDSAVTARADAEGFWQLFVSTPDGSFEPRSVAVAADGECVELNDILIGEVWVCSGQSNMEMPVRGFWSCPVEGAAEVLFTAAEYPWLRCATLPRVESDLPQEDTETCWRRSTPENAGWFSAVGTFFARRLGRGLGVPVGIIVCAWGGSTVEGWLPKEVVSGFPDCAAREKAEYSFARPWLMYNGMFSPARRFTVRGFLWYQGCSNVGDHATYADRLCLMAELWRERWAGNPGRGGELPFYIVEIAPCTYEWEQEGKAAYLREAQLAASRRIPNSGYVSTADLALPHESRQIHPSRKREVGERLAAMALNKTYGMSWLPCESPVFRSFERCGRGCIRLDLDNARDGLNRIRDVEGFEVAGRDRVFRPAHLRHNWDKLEIFCDEVDEIVAVRYCFRDWYESRLTDVWGLPLVPFRSDDWPDAAVAR